MITLKLTEDEAKALFTVTMNVGGQPAGTRGYIDRVRHKLEETQSQWEDSNVNCELDSIRFEIQFKP